MMDDEERIKKALVNIASMLADSFIRNLKYDVHFPARIVGKNEDGTYEVYVTEKGTTLHAVRWSTANEPEVGDNVQVRETKNVADSYMIDYIEP